MHSGVTDSGLDRFHHLIPEIPNVCLQEWQGTWAAFVNGHLFAALFGSVIGVRVDALDAAELRALGSESLDVEPGGTSAEHPQAWFLTIPDDVHPAEWINRALDFMGTRRPLPPT